MSKGTRSLVVSATTMAVAMTIVGAIIFVGALATGQVLPGSLVPLTVPASQPAAVAATQAVQVAKNTTSINWMQWAMGALVLSTLLSTLAASLTNRVPKATGVAQWLLVVADVLSFWGNKNSPTNFNLPGRRSDPPVTSTATIVTVTPIPPLDQPKA